MHFDMLCELADVGFMAVGDEGGFKKVIDPTARVFEYTSPLGFKNLKEPNHSMLKHYGLLGL